MGCKQVKDKGISNQKPKPKEVKDKDKKKKEKGGKVKKEKPEGGEIKKEEGNNKEEINDDQKDKEINKDKDIALEGLNQASEIEYKINVLRNNQNVWFRHFPASTVIYDIIEQFQKEHQGQPLDPEAKILINGQIDFDPQKKLQDFSQYADSDGVIQVSIIDPDSFQPPIQSQAKANTEMNVPLDAFDILQQGQNFFVKPHLNPFGLIIYNNSKKALVFKSFSQNSIEQYNLHLLTNTSAYCNGEKCLFLSGGERNHQIEGNFWIIQLPSIQVTYIDQCIMPKKSHSMIYIPHQYVFIVGGNSRSVTCCDVSQNTFSDFGSLCKDRIEPSLAFMDNKHLYAISYAKNDLTFERCNIRLAPRWKLITPKLAPNVRFTQKFFGIIHQSKDSVLFFGGCQMNDDEDSKCFQFNKLTKELGPSDVPFKEIDFIEKTFSHIDYKTACLIPSCSLNDMNIILFNFEKMDSEIVHFQQERRQEPHERKMKSVIQSLKLENLQLNLNMPNDSLVQQEIQNRNQKGNIQGLIQMN